MVVCVLLCIMFFFCLGPEFKAIRCKTGYFSSKNTGSHTDVVDWSDGVAFKSDGGIEGVQYDFGQCSK